MRNARILEAMPRLLEQQSLLRIHAARFAGGQPEEAVVEAVDPIEQATPLAVRGVGDARIGGVV